MRVGLLHGNTHHLCTAGRSARRLSEPRVGPDHRSRKSIAGGRSRQTTATCMCAARNVGRDHEWTEGKFKGALEALSRTYAGEGSRRNRRSAYAYMVCVDGRIPREETLRVPFVLTTHSLEPLRAWKAEQLGSDMPMSSWMERNGDSGAMQSIAVSKGTRATFKRRIPMSIPAAFTSSTTASIWLNYQKTAETKALQITALTPPCPTFCLSAASLGKKA